ncbi:hypothetical protein M5D96_009516, partial [Drosophila gunungcola]
RSGCPIRVVQFDSNWGLVIFTHPPLFVAPFHFLTSSSLSIVIFIYGDDNEIASQYSSRHPEMPSRCPEM